MVSRGWGCARGIRISRWSTGDLGEGAAKRCVIPNDGSMSWHWYYVQTHSVYTTRWALMWFEPSGDLGCVRISPSHVPLLGGMWIMGKALVGDGGGRYMRNPCTSSQSGFEPKTAFFVLFSLFIYLFAARVLAVACRRFTYGMWILRSAFRIWFLNQGSSPGPLHWERGVLPTGPPGKSLKLFFKKKKSYIGVKEPPKIDLDVGY